MADEFWEVAKQLKPEYMHMVVLVVTKMDQFQADDSLKSRDVAQRQISEIFASDHDVHEVVFSDRLISNENLFNQMYDALKDKPQVQLQYSEAEFLQYFELKAWKGRELHDLHRTKNVVQGITTSFIAGLNDLEEHRSDYTSDEWQDFIFSAIQQCHKELNEGVLDPFVKRNMNAELEFDDYAAYIELRKIVNDAQADVRNEAKRLLPINPDDTSNWVRIVLKFFVLMQLQISISFFLLQRNALRRCQYCGEVWVKVSGCDDETTCGLIPEQGDPYGNEFFLSCMWTKVNGIWKPKKVRETKNIATRTTREIDRHDIKVGCGRKIDWKSQAILPLSEVETLFSTQELEQILNNIGFDIDFVSKKKKKESDIVVFSEVGADGKVVDP